MKLDAIGLGALNVDRLYSVERIAGKGEESFITGCIEASGGSAANTMVGLARLKHRVGYVGKVGDDQEGNFLLKDLQDEHVDTQGVIVAQRNRTGAVIGFIDKQGERTLYVNPGVNDTLGVEEIDIDYINDAHFLHLTSFVGVKSFKTQKAVLPRLSDVQISLDPGELYALKQFEELKPLLKRSYILFPNERELRLLTGKGEKEGARALIEAGVHIVAVKRGGKGCYVTNGREEYRVEAYKVKVVDTTGAGDAFCAGFLHGLLLGKDLYTCGQLANFVAGRKIEKAGARDGLPRLSELPRRLD